MPKIYGRILIRNNGSLIVGKNIIFKNSTVYNMVGINKKSSIYVGDNATLKIGDYSGFSGVSIFCTTMIIFGKYCNIGGNTFIWDTDFHPIGYKARRNNDELQIQSKPIIIGDDVFIGANCIILKGIKIGDRSIVGAGSVVTHSIPSDEIWAGNPAKFVKKVI